MLNRCRDCTGTVGRNALFCPACGAVQKGLGALVFKLTFFFVLGLVLFLLIPTLLFMGFLSALMSAGFRP